MNQRNYLWLLQRTALFSLLWWLLTEGNASSWWFGVPLVLLATGVSTLLAPPSCRSLAGWLRFIPFFIGHSLKGGFDVAWRAMHPALPIAPLLVEYQMRLANEQARVFMANTACLLPGTLGARFEGASLKVHVLDGHGDFHSELETLEKKVAALFCIDLENNDGRI